MDKIELFFMAYYGVSLQFFLIPIAGNQISLGAGFPQMFSTQQALYSEYIGTVLFVIPLIFAFGYLIKSYLEIRRKRIIG